MRRDDAKADVLADRAGDDATHRPPRARLLLARSYVGFVSLGLPDTVLGAAWPPMRTSLGLPLDAAGPLVMLTTSGVVMSSALSGRLRARFRTGAILAASTMLASLALLAVARAQGVPQLWLAALGAGLGGAIEACLNLYVARSATTPRAT